MGLHFSLVCQNWEEISLNSLHPHPAEAFVSLRTLSALFCSLLLTFSAEKSNFLDVVKANKAYIIGGAAAVLLAAGLAVIVTKRAPAKPKAPSWTTAKSLAELGYRYNDNLELVSTSTGAKFTFTDQAHYQKVGDFVIEHIQSELKNKYKLKEIMIPPSENKWAAQINIFASEDYLTNPKMLVLVQGSGAVRPGVWGRALCINDSLKTGSMFPYLDRAIKDGYSILIANPNSNVVHKGTEPVKVDGSESPEQHVQYLYRNYIEPSKAKSVYLVSHSYGGVATVSLIRNIPDAADRINAVAFTDSVHSTGGREVPKVLEEFLQNKCKNWIQSPKPLDTPEEDKNRYGCPCLSAGTTDHASTSSKAIESVFKYFATK